MRKLRYILILPTLVMLGTSIGKIIKAPPLVKNFAAINGEAYMVPLGIIQLVSTILFIVPKTRSVGFFLLTGYIGGIIATRLLNPNEPLGPGIVLGLLLWIGMFFERRELFLPPKAHVS